MDVIDSVIIRGQQDSEKYNQLNPIEVKTDDGTVINILKKYKRATYRFVPVGLLFTSSVKNDTRHIFLITNSLYDAKICLINGKIYNLLVL